MNQGGAGQFGPSPNLGPGILGPPPGAPMEGPPMSSNQNPDVKMQMAAVQMQMIKQVGNISGVLSLCKR